MVLSYQEERKLEELKQAHKLRIIEEARTDSIKDHEMKVERLKKLLDIVLIQKHDLKMEV